MCLCWCDDMFSLQKKISPLYLKVFVTCKQIGTKIGDVSYCHRIGFIVNYWIISMNGTDRLLNSQTDGRPDSYKFNTWSMTPQFCRRLSAVVLVPVPVPALVRCTTIDNCVDEVFTIRCAYYDLLADKRWQTNIQTSLVCSRPFQNTPQAISSQSQSIS